VAAALSLTTHWHDDGLTEGAYDWDLTYEDGRLGALEVTSVQNEDAMAVDARLARDGRTLVVAGLANGWYAHLGLSANVKAVRGTIGSVLLDAQAQGRREIGGAHYAGSDIDDAVAHQVLQDRLRDLDVWWARSSEVLTPGTVSLEHPVVTGFQMEGEPVTAWASGLLAARRSDVNKLRRAAGADERHLFVWLGGMSALVSFGLMETLRAGQPVPPGSPTFPDGITHLWLACDGWTNGRVLLAEAGGWREAGRIVGHGG
jgi:hypothetical protein